MSERRSKQSSDPTRVAVKGRAWWRHRLAAMLALAIPSASGIVYLARSEAPSHFWPVNAAALAIGLVWIALGLVPDAHKARRILSVALLGVMALPLLTGPEINGVARWLQLGPIALHAGMLAVPLLACLAAIDDEYGPAILLSATLIALLQPDAAAAFALMLASVGIYFATRDWKPGVVAILAFIAAVLASVRGELPAQPFVERVLADLILSEPLVALALAVSLFASFFLILFGWSQTLRIRFALAGTFAGFCIAALLQNYPSILIGYGASPILGLALALGLQKLHAAGEEKLNG